MIITPHWSAVEHAALTLPHHVAAFPDETARWLAIAAGVASETGVYTLDDLRREPLTPEFPDSLHRAVQHLLDGTGVYDLDDFRAELRGLTREGAFWPARSASTARTTTSSAPATSA